MLTALVVSFCAACRSIELEPRPIELLRSIVVVDTGSGHGTGFVAKCELIFPDAPEAGYAVTVVTCAHVAKNTIVFRIDRLGTTESDTAICTRLDTVGDVALLTYASDKPIPCLKLADVEPDFGDEVMGINFMLTKTPWAVSGLWCGLGRTTVPCSPGSSGGPLLHRGKVIGMTSHYIHHPHAQGAVRLEALRAALN